MIKSRASYPIEILRKSKAALEMNIRGVPGMFISVELMSEYQRQVREVNKAIEYLELREASRRSKRQAALK